jgi:hypothetical protein
MVHTYITRAADLVVLLLLAAVALFALVRSG